MKENELMLNDMVNTPGGVGRVVTLERLSGIQIDYVEDNSTSTWEDSAIKPIPLTSEILQKSGLKREWLIDYEEAYCINSDIYVAPSSNYWFVILESNDHDCLTDYTLFEIKYVHELQHVMRLMGLNEVADNLKI